MPGKSQTLLDLLRTLSAVDCDTLDIEGLSHLQRAVPQCLLVANLLQLPSSWAHSWIALPTRRVLRFLLPQAPRE